MNISADLIDQIVRDVMRELQSRSSQANAVSRSVPSQSVMSRSPVVNASTPAAKQSAAEQSAAEHSPLIIDQKVVSEDVLQTVGAAGRVISLTPSAILTPSGRDFIRKHDVRLTSRVRQNAGDGPVGLLLTIGEATAAVSAASTAGWDVCTLADETAVAAEVLAKSAGGQVLCCGGQPALICCLLNRDPHMRAAVVTRHTNLKVLGTVMNPQVICIESAGWSMVDIVRLMRLPWSTAAVPPTWQELPGRRPFTGGTS